MRAVVFRGAGGPEVVGVEERPEPTPGRAQVLVRTRFAGVNPADVAQREGRYPPPRDAPPDIPGLEVAGEVVAVGSEVTRWQPGDRVFGLVGGGGMAQLVLAHQDHLAAVPANLEAAAAAAVPEAFITAHDALLQASLNEGELFVVTGANGGVGTAAIQIGLATHARLLAVVRRAEAGQAIAQRFGVKAVTDDAYVDAAKTAGGAAVVIELVCGDSFERSLEALGRRGRIVVVGSMAGRNVQLDLGKLVAKRATVLGTVLRARSIEEKAVAVAAFANKVVPWLADGTVQPLIDSVFPLANVRDAFERLSGPGKFGKVLLEFD
jgi:putative PIG3 family NAD(P)H quinone oxidoreductase